MAPKAKASHKVSHHQKRSHVRDRSGRVLILTDKGGRDLFDRQARKYLGMSGEEFRKRYKEHRLAEYDESDVTRVAMLMPFDRP